MRTPLIFLGPNGPWDLEIFETPEQAKGWAEPQDVAAGEYGDHGWDADGKPVALVLVPWRRQPGFVGWLCSLGSMPEQVDLREIQAPPEPELLRAALCGRLGGLQPDLVLVAGDIALDDLIGLVRGLIHDRLAEVRAGRYPK